MATNGPAPAVMAAAGREAAGMAQRLTDRFLNRPSIRRPRLAPPRAGAGSPITGRASAFAARLLSDARLQSRLGAFSSQVADLASQGRTVTARHPQTLARPLAPKPIMGLERPWKARRGAQGTRNAFLKAPAFRPIAFPHARSAPAPTVFARFEPLRPRPQPILDVFQAPSPVAATVDSPRVPSFEDVLRPVGDSDGLTGIGGLAVPSSHHIRVDTSEDSTRDDADYRLLGPTPLRDMLRRRGGQGTAPDFTLRQRLQGTLGFDPALARLHRGSVAADAARSLRAQAFTIGQDVFFGEGRFDTTSRAGLELLTHELTHVGQQTRSAQHQTRFFTPQGGDAQEEEAQQAAARLMMPTRSPLAHAPVSSSVSPAWSAPEMSLAMPPAPASRAASGSSAPIQRFTDSSGGSGGGSSYVAKPRSPAVADRVYELMKQEALRDNRRGLLTGKGSRS